MSASGIVPPPPVSPGAAAPAGTTTAVIPVAAADLAALPRGQLLEAQVVATEGGVTRLSALLGGGVLTIETTVLPLLPVGSVVTLKVPSEDEGGGTPGLKVAAINGRPAGAFPAEAAAGTAGAARAGTGASVEVPIQGVDAAPATTVGIGTPVPALILEPDPMQDGSGGTAIPGLPPGSRLVIRLTGIETDGGAVLSRSAAEVPSPPAVPEAESPLPSPPAAAPSFVSAAGVQAASLPAASADGAGFPAPAASPLPAGEVSFATAVDAAPPVPADAAAQYAAAGRIGDAVAPVTADAGGAPPPVAASDAALPLAGTVVGHTSLGLPVVETEAGRIALDVQAPLPPGSRVTFEVLASTPPETALSPLPAGADRGNPWASFAALAQVLDESDPQAAALLAQTLPQAGPQLLANLAAAVILLKGGGIRSWPGLDRAEAGSDTRIPPLIARLERDLDTAAPAARRPVGEWRTYVLPFAGGAGIEPIRMVVRRTPDPTDADNPKRAADSRRHQVHFLMDLRLTRLGAMQLDGLVAQKDRRFDLVIRTRTPLPPPMPQDLRSLFARTMEAVGYAGSLALRVTSRFVVPDAGPRPDRGRGVIA